jgi:hypothetical protein
MDVFIHNFIRLGQTRAKALQTDSRFPREIRRRSAVPNSNPFDLFSEAFWWESTTGSPAYLKMIHAFFFSSKVCFEQRCHRLGNFRGLQCFRVFFPWKMQGEAPGMQRQTVKGKIATKIVYGPRRSVSHIPHHRMPG